MISLGAKLAHKIRRLALVMSGVLVCVLAGLWVQSVTFPLTTSRLWGAPDRVRVFESRHGKIHFLYVRTPDGVILAREFDLGLPEMPNTNGRGATLGWDCPTLDPMHRRVSLNVIRPGWLYTSDYLPEGGTARQLSVPFGVGFFKYLNGDAKNPEWRNVIYRVVWFQFILPYWLLILVVGFPGLWLIAREAYRRGRAWYLLRYHSHLCSTCGYDMRATPTRCPECGAERPSPAVVNLHP